MWLKLLALTAGLTLLMLGFLVGNTNIVLAGAMVLFVVAVFVDLRSSKQ